MFMPTIIRWNQKGEDGAFWNISVKTANITIPQYFGIETFHFKGGGGGAFQRIHYYFILSAYKKLFPPTTSITTRFAWTTCGVVLNHVFSSNNVNNFLGVQKRNRAETITRFWQGKRNIPNTFAFIFSLSWSPTEVMQKLKLSQKHTALQSQHDQMFPVYLFPTSLSSCILVFTPKVFI